jgi:hypothetical protein
VIRAARSRSTDRYETAKPHLPDQSAESDREAGTDIVIRLSLLLVQLSLISGRLRFKAMVDEDAVTARNAHGESGRGSDVNEREEREVHQKAATNE